MTPRRFRWHRFSAVLRFDPTGTAEVLIAFCFVIIPGFFFLFGVSGLPPHVYWYFWKLGFTESLLGGWLILGGMAQLWGLATNWYTGRAWIAVAVEFSLMSIVVAYIRSGYTQRLSVAYLVGTILAEMFIAWRCWHERPDPSPSREVGMRANATTQ
jgi:hypothetical protein